MNVLFVFAPGQALPSRRQVMYALLCSQRAVSEVRVGRPRELASGQAGRLRRRAEELRLELGAVALAGIESRFWHCR
eukprot:2163571-Pleurochrysis_carterae.AAC.2